MRVALFAVVLASAPALAQQPLPPRIVALDAGTNPFIHAGYLDATLYGVDPTGATDSTVALQAAIDDGMNYGLATYLPSGTYTVSDTLKGFAKWTTQCTSHMQTPQGDWVWQSPTMVGPASGPRPVLQLKDNAAGFNDPNNLKALVYFVELGNPTPDPGGWQGNPGCLMFGAIRDVSLRLGSGNAGAVGIQYPGSQSTYIENVDVDATGAYAGLRGVPSTNNIVNISVTGGQYGIIPATCCGISLVGVTLKNQTVAALDMANGGASAVVGFDIEEPAGSAVLNSAWDNQTSQLALIDGTITVASGSAPAIENNAPHDLYIDNVYVQTPGSLVQSGALAPVAGTGAVDLIQEYSYTDPNPATFNGATARSYHLIDGVQGQNEIAAVQHGATAPTDSVTRHLPGPLPWFRDPGVLDVTTLGADPDGVKDSTAAIQAAINQSDLVFLPRGNYIISAPLLLKPNTKLFGVPGRRSNIKGANSWDPQGKYLPLVESASTTTGATYLGDLGLMLPDSSYAQTYLSALDWQAGRSSVVNQIAVELPWQNNIWWSHNRSLVHIEGNGGGRWYGLQQALTNPTKSASPDGGFRNALVEGTTAPLTFYGPNWEHAQNEPELELRGAQNVRVLGTKSEALFEFEAENSANIMFAAHSGHDWVGAGLANLLIVDSSDVVMPVAQMYTNNGYSPQGFIVEELVNGSRDGGVPAVDQCSLFARGTFDETKFPYCGDGVCDGAETNANCPADCGAGGSSGGTTSGGNTGGAVWTACRAPEPFPLGGDLSGWAGVPSFLLPYSAAIVGPSSPVTPASDAQLSASVQAAWDGTNVYVLVRVTDPAVVDFPDAGALYENDGVELYLDGKDSRLPAYDAGDYQLTVTAFDQATPIAGSFGHSAVRTDGGYAVEYAVPWTLLVGNDGGAVGFDVAVNANDGGGPWRESQLMWSGDGNAYRDPTQFGQLLLGGQACGATGSSSDGGTAGGSAGSSGGGSSGGAPGATGTSSSSGGSVASGVAGGCNCGTGSAGDLPWCLAWTLVVLGRRRVRGRAKVSGPGHHPAGARRADPEACPARVRTN